jgi:bisphosphoglycerate-independent phosphoglycerate mutase (AlkP superfamily)
MGAVARSAWQVGVRLRGPADLAEGRAVSAFLTNAGWRERLGHDVPDITEAEAGSQLARLAQAYDFTLFESYVTDVVGHRGTLPEAVALLARLDRFLGGVLDGWPADEVLVVASDHGNLEDLGTGRHTLNPALGLWRGPGPARPLAALTDVAPAVLEALGVPEAAAQST